VDGHGEGVPHKALRVQEKTMMSALTGTKGVRRPTHGWARLVWLVPLLMAVAGCDSETSSEPTPAATSNTPPAAAPSAQAASQALAAWQGMWRAYANAGRSANPNDPELSRYASGGALTTLQNGLRAYAAKGQVLKGDPTTDPQITQLSPPGQPTTATITDCLDDTRFLVYDRSGKPVNDEPGGPRHTEGTVSKTAGGWRVTSFGVQEPGTC
jgi:hypothetical protein